MFKLKIVNFILENKFLVSLFLLLVLSFNINLLGLGQTNNWFSSFQTDSAAIVEKSVECSGAIDSYSGSMIVKKGYSYGDIMMKPGCESEKLQPYVSQFGLQSHAFSFISSLFGNYERVLKVISILLTIVFAATLTVFVKKFYEQFGKFVSISLSIGILLSPWLAGYAGNLYWIVFTIFLPFIFSFCVYNFLKRRKWLIWFYTGLFILFTLKFLNGYEYASTVILSAFIPIAFYELKALKFKPLLKLWRQALLVVGVGAIALAGSVCINATSLKGYAGSWSGAFEMVLARADDRSSINNYQYLVVNSLRSTAPSIYELINMFYNTDQLEDGKANPVKYIVLSAINYAMLPAISIPLQIKEPFSTVVQSILVMGLLAGILLAQLKKNNHTRKMAEKLGIMYWLGLLGALSWLVLMPGHSYVHPHINAIVFYIPFLLASYSIIGLYLHSIMKRNN